ncbi:MAG: ROK family glucokinase [Candidatus Enteromonas sp.]|nr:ROK family glucokinase [Candidatus Enteromonas sp.]
MLAIGVDIGGTSIKTGLVNESGEILQKWVLPIVKDRNGEETIVALGAQIREGLEALGIAKKNIKGIGIGCPGSIDSENGTCDFAGNLNWEKLPIVPILEKELGIPSFITNDANAGALGEAIFGAAKGKKNVILITLGTGVGGGLILDGKLYEGNKSKGAELGHSLLVMDGRPCTCGRKGCIEAYASVTALISDTKAMMVEDPDSAMWDYVNGDIEQVNGKTAFECAKKGDVSAQKVVDQYIHFLGESLINFINVFRPETIVLGGGLSGQKESLTKPVIHYLREREYGFGGLLSPMVDIVVSNLGNDAGILGAASLVYNAK